MAEIKVKVGIIGGSGLDDPEILDGRKETYRETPYGNKMKKKKLFPMEINPISMEKFTNFLHFHCEQAHPLMFLLKAK